MTPGKSDHAPSMALGPRRGIEVEIAQELLATLDAATSLSDLSPLKSVGLHKLKGDRAGQWAMTVNRRWRICFADRIEARAAR
jgi:toxin HigB-1